MPAGRRLHPRRRAPCCATPTVSASSAVDPPPPTEAQIKAGAHALLDAYDRMDEAAFVAELGLTFALFEGRALHARSALLERMASRARRGAPPRTRVFRDEQVRLSAGAAVYLCETVEHVPADAQQPGGDYTGINTLVFAPEAGSFKAVHWAWEPSGIEGDRQLWNAEYSAPRNLEERPNELLVERVRGLRPGSALDVGSGVGRNALFLASQGWRVTGVDISDVGLRITEERARTRKLKLDLVEADLTQWDFGRERWDLVSLIYMGRNAATIGKVQASLKPGGLFVHEGFVPEPGLSVAQGGSLEELAAQFSEGFTILRSEVVEGVSDWGKRKEKLMRFVARKH